MASAIDITKPVYGNPSTQSVRDNFEHAYDEITTLQTDVTNRVAKSGDTMNGDLTLYADPTLAMHAANRAWVINQIRSTANATIYIGDYDAAADRVLTSGQASIPVASPLPAAGPNNTQMYFTVKVGKAAPSIGNQPPGGVPVGSWLISNGVDWNVYQPSSAGLTAASVPVSPAIAGLPGGSVQDALTSVPALYLPLVGGNISGNLSLATNPTLAAHAATKSYVDGITKVASFNTRTGPVTLQQTDIRSVGALNDVGRNFVHNSMFNIQQRGVGSFTIDNSYTADRWALRFLGGTMNASLSSISLAIGAASFGDEACKNIFICSSTGGAGADNYNIVQQRIDDVTKLSGKTVTLSFWSWCDNGSSKIGIEMEQVFAGGGTPTDSIGSRTFNLVAATPTKFTTTFTIPSASGKTIGASGFNGSSLNFWFSAGSNYAARSGGVGVQSGVFYLWGIQLEIGSVATPLEKPDPQQELAKCQRYYEVGSIFNSTYMVAGQTAVVWCPFAVVKRAAPTTVFTNTTFSNGSNVSNSGGNAAGLGHAWTATAQGQTWCSTTFAVSADL